MDTSRPFADPRKIENLVGCDVDLGRAWQIALFVGLILWLVLMLRGFWPAFQRRDK